MFMEMLLLGLHLLFIIKSKTYNKMLNKKNYSIIIYYVIHSLVLLVAIYRLYNIGEIDYCKKTFDPHCIDSFFGNLFLFLFLYLVMFAFNVNKSRKMTMLFIVVNIIMVYIPVANLKNYHLLPFIIVESIIFMLLFYFKVSKNKTTLPK
jgi:hypothetical protein